ncbi:MAG: hypothetical protein WBD20_01010 [Pirellulaceae bacterium]
MPDNELQIQCPIQGTIPFAPCPDHEVTPLIEHLKMNRPVEAQTEFPRGTVLPDGRLDLCKQSLGVTGCLRVADALRDNQQIRSLLLGTDGIGDEGATSIGELIHGNASLEIVYLGCNGITSDGAKSLADSMSTQSSVQGLWLKRNPIGNQGVGAIARMIEKGNSLRVLDLVNTGIGRTGISRLCQSLMSEECRIERLYLGGNGLDEVAAGCLAEVLSSNTGLKSLLLNVGAIGDSGAIAIADALQNNTSLRELGLASNGITARGADPVLRSVANHPALANLDLGYSRSTRVLGASANSLDDEVGVQIARVLEGKAVLTRLNLAKCGIGQRGRAAIESALLVNQTIQHLVIDGGLSEAARTRLMENRSRAVELDQPSSDVTLVRSVYRTAKIQ